MLNYEFGRDISNRQGFVDFHRRYWTSNPDPQGIGEKYTFQHVYDLSQRITRANNGFANATYDGSIAVALESTCLHTNGSPLEIPHTWGELTADGTWSTYDQTGNTVVLITFTVERELRNVAVGNRRIPDEALEYFLEFFADKEFKRTFSPYTPSAAHIHLRHGGKPLALFEKARAGLFLNGTCAEDVIVFGYGDRHYDEKLLDRISRL